MEEINLEVYDEARIFLDEVKEIIKEVKRIHKKLVYASKDLLIFELEENTDTVYEVHDRDKVGFSSRLVYIGDPKVKVSYLLNLIHKQEMKNDPNTYKHR